MLSTAEVAAMQATQAAALPATCSIQRASLTPDGAGGWTAAWATLASGVACRLSAVSTPTERVVAQKYEGRTLWQLTLPASTDIRHEDRVIIGSASYEVVGIQSGGAWETARRVLLVQVE